MSFSKPLDTLHYIFQPVLTFSEQELGGDVAHQPAGEFTLHGEYGRTPLLLGRLGTCCH